MQNTFLVRLGVSCLAFAVGVMGSEAAEGLRASETNGVSLLDTIVVTATRSEASTRDLPYSVVSLDGEALRRERMAASVPEALREVPGVMIQQTAHG